jgi:hypothetical protein
MIAECRSEVGLGPVNEGWLQQKYAISNRLDLRSASSSSVLTAE